MGSKTTPRPRRPAPRPGSGRAAGASRTRGIQADRRRALTRLGVGMIVGVAVLFGLFSIGRDGGSAGSGGPRFDVGSPAAGEMAPNFRLPSAAGGSYELAAARGKTVLLYFQEGLMCQPCWDQIRDIEKNMAAFKAEGVEELVSITVNDVDQLREKVADEELSTPVLSDPDVTLGETYNANQYGMMGDSTYGHSFILVGPDGRIRWRADYGGSPDYTMYVSVPALLDDLRAGLAT